MRLTPLRLALLFGAALFLLGPTTALTQPGGGKKGKKGFDPSADDGGMSRGKGKGFTRPDDGGGAAPGGFGPGGMGKGNFDPSQMADRMFTQMSGGKDVIVISEVPTQGRGFDPNPQETLQKWAQSQGITNGQITRDQYAKYMQERMATRLGGGSPRGNSDQARDYDKEAEDRFRRSDANGDGVLTLEEMPRTLRDNNEWQKWDKNNDGVIDLAEYKEYYKARMQFIREGQDANNQDPRNRDNPNNPQGDPIVEDDKRPTVYKVGHLPKELPAWFAQMDTDKDGQVGLYEWKNAGADLHVFAEIDTNSDGLLTVEEVLRWQKAQALAKKRTPGASAVGEDEEDPDGAPKVTPKIQTIYGLNGPDGQGGPGGFNRGPGGQGGPGGFNRGPGGQGGPGGFNRGPGGQGGPGRGTGDANSGNANPFGKTRGQGQGQGRSQ